MTLTITDTVHPQVGHSVKLPCIVRQIGSKTVWIFTIIFSYFHVFSHPQNLDQIVCVSSVQALSGALGNLWCRFSLFSHCADFQSAENNCRQSCFTSDRSTNKQDPEATKHFIFWQKHFSSKMRWTSERCHMPSDLQRPSQFLNKSSTTLVIKRILSKLKQNFIQWSEW